MGKILYIAGPQILVLPRAGGPVTQSLDPIPKKFVFYCTYDSKKY